ncbi:MFS transporter [Streptomyces sp. NPDC052071]|uniref:MFS transporter n=1 Tax=Streptomyces sp. NPDC052071 TaxID=3156666 RepID=UPI0034480FC3
MNRPLAALVSGAFAHRIAQGFYDLTLPLLVLHITDSALLMSLMFATGYLSELVVSVFGGALVDRTGRRKLLIGIATAEAAVLMAAGTALLAHALSTPLLFLTAFAIDGLVRLYQLADSTALAWIVPPEELPRAHGYMQMALSTARTSGPALCGLAIATVGLTGSVWITAATFVPLLVMMLVVRWPAPLVGETARKSEDQGFLASAADGLMYTLRTPIFRVVLIWQGAFNFLFGAAYLMFLFYFQEELRLKSWQIGTVMAMGAAGGFLGGLAYARLQARYRSGPLMLGSTTAMGVLMLLMTWATHWLPLGALVATMMFHGSQISRLTAMLFQVTAPPHMLGRVTAASQILTTASGPVSVLSAGWLAGQHGARWVFGIVGASVLLLAAVSQRSLLARSDWGIRAEQTPQALPLPRPQPSPTSP